jgi:hypothetical protein
VRRHRACDERHETMYDHRVRSGRRSRRSMVPIREDFQDYVAPRWFKRTVERLLGSVSSAHTQGLSAIVLTNSTRAVRRKGGRSSRRQRRGTPIGRYHKAYRGERAWVELIVDRIVAQMPRPVQYVQLLREMAVGHVLYHELGHHLHETVGSAARGGEPSAEAWRSRLSRLYIKKRYGFLFVQPIRMVVHPLIKIASRRYRRSHRNTESAVYRSAREETKQSGP